jgi:hypothetical protein
MISRAIRAAMRAEDWAALERLVRMARTAGEPTDARARGAVLSALLNASRAATATGAPDPATENAEGSEPRPSPAAWLDWEKEKFLRLARPA